MRWAGGAPYWWPALNTQVEPTRSTHDPSLMKGAWWTWPAKTMSGWYSSIHLRQLDVAIGPAAAPARRRLARGRVVDPDPGALWAGRRRRGTGRRSPRARSGRPTRRRPRRACRRSPTTGRRSTTPGTSRIQRETFSPSPLRESRSWLPEQMMSRVFSRSRARYLPMTTIWALRVDDRAEVEMVAGDDHHVEVRRDAQSPSRTGGGNSAGRQRRGGASDSLYCPAISDSCPARRTIMHAICKRHATGARTTTIFAIAAERPARRSGPAEGRPPGMADTHPLQLGLRPVCMLSEQQHQADWEAADDPETPAHRECLHCDADIGRGLTAARWRRCRPTGRAPARSARSSTTLVSMMR